MAVLPPNTTAIPPPVLVPNAIQTYLNGIYKPSNVEFTITSDTTQFDLGTGANAGLERSDESVFGKYSLEMRALKSHYMAKHPNYNKKATYIFVVPSFTGGGLDGFMVRGRSVGFVTGAADMRTYAHELGHGVFGLEHTFPEIEKPTTNNLMDYGTGTHLTHEQWKIMHARKPAYSWFDTEEDGSFEKYNLTPDWLPFKHQVTSIYVGGASIEQPNGAVFAILYEKKIYDWNSIRNKYVYGTASDAPELPETTYYTATVDNGEVIDLYWNIGKCGYNKSYRTAWGYIKDKKNTFDPDTDTSGKVTYNGTITCSGDPRTKIPCTNIDLNKLNIDKQALLALLADTNTSLTIIVTKVLATEYCTLIELPSEKLEEFAKKLADQSSYDTDTEKAILKLLKCVRDDKVLDFYTNVLAADSNSILDKIVKNTTNAKYIVLSDGHLDSFIEELAYIVTKLDTDAKKWNCINRLVKNKVSATKDANPKVLKNMFGALSIYTTNSDLEAITLSFQHLLIADCNKINNFAEVLNLAQIRVKNPDAFTYFTQSDNRTFEFATTRLLQLNVLNWLIPDVIRFDPNNRIELADLDDFYAWSDYLEKNSSVQGLLVSDPDLFLSEFRTQLDAFILTRTQASSAFWANLQLNTCTHIVNAFRQVEYGESIETLRLVSKTTKIALINKAFGNLCSSLPEYSTTQDRLMKLLASFDKNDKDILLALEAIGFDRLYDAFSEVRLGKLCIWVSQQITESGHLLPLTTAEFKQTGTNNIITANTTTNANILQLDSDLLGSVNFKANLGTSKTNFTVRGRSIPYNKMVLVYVAGDFEFIEQKFKQGTLMQMPMIQAFAMSNSNRNIIATKAAWVGVDAVSLLCGIGEIKILFTAGNYIRKGIIVSDLVASGAGILVNVLNENAISPQLRFRLELLSILGSLPQLSTNLQGINNLITDTDNALNAISSPNKALVVDYFTQIKTRLGVSNIINLLGKIRSPLTRGWMGAMGPKIKIKANNKLAFDQSAAAPNANNLPEFGRLDDIPGSTTGEKVLKIETPDMLNTPPASTNTILELSDDIEVVLPNGSATAPVRAKLAFVETAPNVIKVMPVRFSSDIGPVSINGVKRVQKVSNTPNTPTTQGQALSIKDENVLNNITLTINNPTVINTTTPIIGDLVVKRESVFAGVSADIEKAMAKELATPPTVAGGSSSIIQTSATSAQELVIIETNLITVAGSPAERYILLAKRSRNNSQGAGQSALEVVMMAKTGSSGQAQSMNNTSNVAQQVLQVLRQVTNTPQTQNAPNCTAFDTSKLRAKNAGISEANANEAIRKLCLNIPQTERATFNTQLLTYQNAEIRAFFDDIRLTIPNDTRHISSNINSTFGIEQLKAWKKLYTSGFETDFEYIRTLSFRGRIPYGTGLGILVDITTYDVTVLGTKNVVISSGVNGIGEQLNYVPMNSSLNRGQWNSMEDEWKTILEGRPNATPPIPSQTVEINIQIEYDGSRRPIYFEVQYSYGGAPQLVVTPIVNQSPVPTSVAGSPIFIIANL